MEYNRRGHQLYEMLAMSVATGGLRTIVREQSNTFVNYSRLWRQFIDVPGGKDGGKKRMLLWTSERDNWNHLYLYDVASGKLVRQVTRGEWPVRSVQYVDEAKGVVYFSASGMNKDEDPYLVHYYKIGLDGKNLTCLTPENANHRAVYSSDYRYLVDTYSRVDLPPVTVPQW